MLATAHKAAGARLCRAFAIAWASLALPAGAAEYYQRSSAECAVDGNGLAYQCASSTNGLGAFRGPSLARPALAPGDTIYTCSKMVLSSSVSMATGPSPSGAPGNPITLDMRCPVGGGAYAQGEFDANGNNYALNASAGSPSHWTVRNSIFRNANNDCVHLQESTATGWRFENVLIEDCVNDGLDIDDAADDGVTLAYVTVRRAGVHGIACNSTKGNTWHHLRVEDSGTTAVNGDGVAINDGCGDGKIVEDVVVLRQKGGGGVDLQDSTGTGVVTLRRAWLEGMVEHAGYLATGSSQIIDAYDVVSINNGFNVYLKNTTGLHRLSHFTTFGAVNTELKIGDSGTSGASMTAAIRNSSFGGAECKAAVLYLRNVPEVVVDSDYNHFCPNGSFQPTSSSAKDFAGWKSFSGQDAHSINVDPKFVGGPNPTTAEGFRLSADSPLIGAGTDLGDEIDDFFGDPLYNGSWDIGAFRRDSCYRRSRDGKLDMARTRSQVVSRCLGVPGRYPEGL